jgi:hypothetical protein
MFFDSYVCRCRVLLRALRAAGFRMVMAALLSGRRLA